ncbi:MAG: hypothetical protein J0I29_07030 [Rhizobiales bacterium]|nr:hypothetical protein [Hyphomicrobiales bacterium]
MPTGTSLALSDAMEGLGMMDSFSIADTTWVFFGLVGCLLIASTALFWSIEDQRAKRQVTQKRRF